MAKGIRSKVKRANRTYKRKTLIEPKIKKQVEAFNDRLKQISIKKSAPSIMGLKNLINNRNKQKMKVDGDDDNDDNDNNDDEDDGDDDDDDNEEPINIAKGLSYDNIKNAKAFYNG